MFVNEALLNPEKVFELPNIEKIVTVDRNRYPDDWLDQLCKTLNRLSNKPFIIRKFLSDHLDGSYTNKESLLDGLAYIYEAIKKATQEKAVSNETKSRFTSLTARLAEVINKCTPAFHICVNSIVCSLQAKNESITEMLFNLRMFLVNTAASNASDDVHVFNRFYCVGNTLGLGVIPFLRQDPFLSKISDEDIEAKLKRMFLIKYTPLTIIDYLVETIQRNLRDKGLYDGRRKEGYALIEYDAWIDYLQNLLGKEYKIGYEICLLDDESGNPVDINRSILFRLVHSYLISKKMVLTPLSKILSTSMHNKVSTEDLNLLAAFRYKDKLLIKEAVKRNINPNLYINEKNDSLLMWATQHNETMIALAIIAKGADLEVKNEDGKTALFVALDHANTRICSALIEKGANFEEKDEHGNTPLLIAINNHETEIALALIEKGANFEEKDENGNTPLLIAINNHETEIALALIKKGASIEEKNEDGDAALTSATLNFNAKVALWLIEQGADLYIKNKLGETALHLAALTGNLNIAVALIEKGAGIDNMDLHGNTALHLAIKKGETDIASMLIDRGANINATNYNGDIPLFLAITKGHTELALKLIKKGSYLDIQNIHGGTHSALLLELSKGRTGTASTLIEEGARLDEKNKAGNTPLILAITKGYKKIALALIKKGAKLDERNEAGNTALILAVTKGYQKIALALIEKGARLDERNNERTKVLTIAKARGNQKIVLALGENGLKHDERNSHADKAVIIVAQKGDEHLADMPVKIGVNLTLKNGEGKIALVAAPTDTLTKIQKDRGTKNTVETFFNKKREVRLEEEDQWLHSEPKETLSTYI